MRALKQEIEILKNMVDDEIIKRTMDKIVEMNDQNSKKNYGSVAKHLSTKPLPTSPIVLLLKIAVQSSASYFIDIL